MKLFTLSLFALGAMLTSNAFAATGTGEAQAELSSPLKIENATDLNFGTIAIDPGAGTQTLTINTSANVTCPATYVCSGSHMRGEVKLTGSPGALVHVDMTGSSAILSDGLGNTLTFDPAFANLTDSYNIPAPVGGFVTFGIGGSIIFTGDEVSGNYSSRNAGGSGYILTVNY